MLIPAKFQLIIHPICEYRQRVSIFTALFGSKLLTSIGKIQRKGSANSKNPNPKYACKENMKYQMIWDASEEI